MTPKNFERYCKRNKPTKIVAADYGMEFYFANGKRIDVRNGIDHLHYIKYCKPKPNAGKELIASLLEFTPMFMDDIKRKYGQPLPKI
jgi:hypothetical protein